jgi:hypothetical protein
MQGMSNLKIVHKKSRIGFKRSYKGRASYFLAEEGTVDVKAGQYLCEV